MDVIFDKCDVYSQGSVSVSRLMSCVEERLLANGPMNELQKQLLEEVERKLSVSRVDAEVDKSTWTAAWCDDKGTDDESVLDGVLNNNNQVVDEFSLFNSSCNSDILNQSKHSYRFSPSCSSSPSSELNSSENEEIANLRHHNRRLEESVRLMQSQLQHIEDENSSEQARNKELVKTISRLEERIEGLTGDRETHMVLLADYEAEKLSLCSTARAQEEKIKELENEIEERIEESHRLNAELNEKCEHLAALQSKLHTTETGFVEMCKKLQEKSQLKQIEIDKCSAEKEEMKRRLCWEIQILKARCEELELYQSKAVIYTPPSTANLSCSSQGDASIGSEDVPSCETWHSVTPDVTSTVMTFPVENQETNSILQEFEIVGSFLSTVSSDSSSSEAEDEALKQTPTDVTGACSPSVSRDVVFNTTKAKGTHTTQEHCNADTSTSQLADGYTQTSPCKSRACSSFTDANTQVPDLCNTSVQTSPHKSCASLRCADAYTQVPNLHSTSVQTSPHKRRASLRFTDGTTQVPNLHNTSVQTLVHESKEQHTQEMKVFSFWGQVDRKRSYFFWKIILIVTLFCFLLFYGTIILTSTVLEVIVESGAIDKGVLGKPVPWMSTFTSKFKPFVQVNTKTAVVPV